MIFFHPFFIKENEFTKFIVSCPIIFIMKMRNLRNFKKSEGAL